MDENEILKMYKGWLHAVAMSLAPRQKDKWQDLVQEGSIAMWKAMKTYDPGKGALPTWLTGAARMRMRDVLFRDTWTGTPGQRGHVREKPATPVDTDWDWVDELVGSSPEVLDGVLLSYHEGEILKALNALPKEQREYIFLRFWCGWGGQKGPSLKEHFGRDVNYLWSQVGSGARDRLRESLAHLNV